MCFQAAELVSKNWEAYEAHMRDVRDYLEASLEVSTSGPFSQPEAAGSGTWSRVGMSLWPCPPLQKARAAWKPRGSQPSDFSRPPLGNRGFASTVTLRAPSDSATPVTSLSWAQAFKVALILPLSHDDYTEPSTSQHLWLRLVGTWHDPGREVRPWREPWHWESCSCVACAAGRRVLAHCKVLLASVGAACHSEKGDR